MTQSAEWQERLDRDGAVVVDQRRSSSFAGYAFMVIGVFLVALNLLDIVAHGPRVVNVIGVLVFGLGALAPVLRRRQENRSLIVTSEGVRLRDGLTVPFDRVVEIYCTSRNFLVLYDALPEERSKGKDGRRSVVLRLAEGFPADDLAVWILHLRDGPNAEVVRRTGRGGMRIFGTSP